MNIQDLIGGAAAVVINPHAVVAITIDRYLTGAQLEVIGGHFQKKLPNNKVIVLQKGMTVEVASVVNSAEMVLPPQHADTIRRLVDAETA